MKSIKRFAKKTLSLVLCLAMVMTTVIFFEIGIPKTQAKVTKEDTDMNDVLFYVPEAIYLRPHSDSWTAGTTSTFHFFIENNVTNGANLVTSPSPNTSTPTTGNVYFQYADAQDDDVYSVQLSYRWLSSDLKTALSGNGIRLGSSDVGVNQNLVLSKASGTNYYKTTIAAANSKSPHLAAGETGCYIEWTAKFHDNADNLDKSVTAYTYVYKPNVVPLGGAAYTKEAEGGNSFHSSLSWLTGFHSIKSSATGNGGTYYGRYTTTALGSFGFMPFQTRAGAEAINDNTAGAVGSVQAWNLGDSKISEKSSLATQDALYFASTNTSYAYFKANQANSGFSNVDSFNWAANDAVAGTSATGATTYSVKNFVHTNQQSDSSDSDNRRRSICIDNNAVASLVVDTSRYTNLAYVPNLGVGMLYCNDENTDGGMWYVADYTGRTNSQPMHDYSSGGDYASTALQNNWDDHGKYIIRVGNVPNDRPSDGAYGIEEEGVKYSGAWDSALSDTGLATALKRHKVKTATYTHDDGEEGSLITVVFNMDVQQYNKSMLRTAVANAQKEFALLGIYDNSYNSHYYNNTGAYTTFIEAYKNACHALTAVNTTITNPDNLAIALNNALSALKAEKDVYETDSNGNVVYDEDGNVKMTTDSCRKSGIANQFNVGLLRNKDGSYRLISIPGAESPSVPYNYRDKLEFEAETYTGYSYAGMFKLSAGTSVDALLEEAYRVTTYPETWTTADFRYDIDAKQNSDKTTSFISTGRITAATQVATFNGSTVTYPYAHDAETTYMYVYLLDAGEILFDNEFDFDDTRWNKPTGGTQVVDHVNNTVTLTGTADNAYTETYKIADQRGYMHLAPGRSYRYSAKCENLSDKEVKIQMFFFTYASPDAAEGTQHVSEITLPANSTMYIKDANNTNYVTVPDANQYATLRVGFLNGNGATVRFSDICVRDISTFIDDKTPNTIYLDGDSTQDYTKIPLNVNAQPLSTVEVNYENGTAPKLKRSGYQFAGWSTVRAANGNGDIDYAVTSTTIPEHGNRKLYAIWLTNTIYKAPEGETLLYRKSADPMQTSYQVEGRWNMRPGTSVPVSNRISQGQTGWNSTDVNYTYVPYKPGYNFKGWKAVSIDPSVNGNVYWPTQTVVTNANVEFTALWEAAPAVTLNATNRITSSSNDGNRAFYPGQVHFYKYTPATNQYASAYTYNSEGDLDMQAFDGAFNFVAENDNHEYSYGIQDIAETDPMITMTLEAGKTYYAGITMHSITGTIAGGTNFRIQEHTVEYTLHPSGGLINGSQETQIVTGYANVDTVLPSNGEKHGYDFDKWTSGETPEKEYAAGAKIPGADNHDRLDGYTESLTKKVNLYAQWSPKPFSIIYNKNIPANATPTDASPMPATGTLRYATDGSISEIVPSMAGYTFKGWATTSEKIEGEKLYQKGEAITASTATAFFDANNGGALTLYARWAPNLIIVRFKPGAGTGTEFTQNFWYDQEQKIDTQNFDPEKYSVGFYEVGTTEAIETHKADLEFDGWQDVLTGTPNYTYANGAIIKNPNGVTGTSDTVGTETILYAKWKGGSSTVTTPVWTSRADTHVLLGWANPNDDTPDYETVDYVAGEAFAPSGDMKLYAVWYPVETAETNINRLKDYEGTTSVVTGVEFTNSDLTEYKAIESPTKYPLYDTTEYKAAVQRYENARDALKNHATKENNTEYYASIKAVEELGTPEAQAPIVSYTEQFTISYADGVEGKVAAGENYKLADMNLNHYSTDVLDAALAAWNSARGVTNRLGQGEINTAVATMARAYASKQDLNTKPVYNMYDTVDTIKESNLIESEDITAMNYVYTGKGNYTYYCYTNSKTPTILLTVDDEKVNNRYCYPTTFDSSATIVSSTKGAEAEMPEYDSVSDSLAKSKYDKYLAVSIGLTAEGKALDASYYYQKAMVELKPDFSNITEGVNNATVTYTFSARDDAFAGLNGEDINYADSAKLASGAAKGEVANIPNTDNAVTPENTITIIVDYHEGAGFDVTGQQVQDDEWLKQYHLARSSGGASNWELPVPGDSVYTVYDETYGQTDYGSFTYTFVVGEANDIANCVLTSSDVNDVIGIVKENYDAMKSVPFDGAQEIWQWAHDKNDGNLFKYMCTHEAGTGLGFKSWPNTNWSFNYYPLSGAYTYVHLVDRWGNTVDKVIQVPNLDGSATQLHTNSAGKVEAIEMGGSGIDTMSFSAQSFDIIAEEGSTFDGETYTTTGNTIKVYTGEANKKYTLEANDVATNKTTENVTTDAEGYLTITVEDKAFDKESGAYTFSLNGMEINLYAEVEKNVISATSDPVEKGQSAIVEIVTSAKVETVQLVSETGTTTTISKYTEDEDGNRVWTAKKNKEVGEYEYKIRFKADGRWTTEGDTVTVTVTEPIIFVGAVTNVEYTPSTSTRNEFMFTVTGRPDKIQVIEPDGGTRTYDRYHVKVVIVSYDENGNVVGAMSRELSYEVWTIEMNVPADMELTAVAKYGKTWSKEAPYKYTVVLATPEFDDEVYSMSLAAEEGWQGRVAATVVTGLDVKGVQFVMDNNTTATYYSSTEADGKLTYVGNAWINHSGENIIIVKIRVNNAWIKAGELNYYAI